MDYQIRGSCKYTKTIAIHLKVASCNNMQLRIFNEHTYLFLPPTQALKLIIPSIAQNQTRMICSNIKPPLLYRREKCYIARSMIEPKIVCDTNILCYFEEKDRLRRFVSRYGKET